MGLSTQQQILIEQRVANEAKSIGVAYVLWFFLGLLGAHRFYLGRKGSGAAMLALAVIGILSAPVGGTVLLAGVAIWALVDAFLIPGLVQAHKNDIRRNLGIEAMISDAAEFPVDTSKWAQADKQRFISQRISGR
ncbi:TM2 domain-containing protein [Mesorhizobium sp. M6A.T.Ce.TU.016.01.1.1]|uniref:TM2 domain-containing protein n=1 Tax=Mesorhizobium sp. M6A.T.Ce.TU.016.01.1.1 TaxID=2496783 RepID=UPI000FCA4FAF|nr:TM2 domain-containing protein [Mesorhizobium sp. M6A.T.Ce.TU.016.01.1.1]RUU29768.1 TM2 domain-containing protein [Mesorhizobium sp. M6A.T.Ce.TU.016.01.1.1]